MAPVEEGGYGTDEQQVAEGGCIGCKRRIGCHKHESSREGQSDGAEAIEDGGGASLLAASCLLCIGPGAKTKDDAEEEADTE